MGKTSSRRSNKKFKPRRLLKSKKKEKYSVYLPKDMGSAPYGGYDANKKRF